MGSQDSCGSLLAHSRRRCKKAEGRPHWWLLLRVVASDETTGKLANGNGLISGCDEPPNQHKKVARRE